MMVEHGEAFWKERWEPLYSFLGGNPLAAMPSLHFATSLMAAHLLAEAGPVEGAVGWTYALTLGFALVYLGEHYVVDLLAGARADRGRPRARRRPSRRPARALSARACSDSSAGRADDATARPSRTSTPDEEEVDDDEEMPRIEHHAAHRLLLGGSSSSPSIAFLYFVLPQLAGLGTRGSGSRTATRAGCSSRCVFTALSFAGYVVALPGRLRARRLPAPAARATRSRWPGWRRRALFAAGGAGGIALTAWALRRAGMPRRAVADQMLAFLVLTYGVYMAGARRRAASGCYCGILAGLAATARSRCSRRSSAWSRSRSRCWRR